MDDGLRRPETAPAAGWQRVQAVDAGRLAVLIAAAAGIRWLVGPRLLSRLLAGWARRYLGLGPITYYLSAGLLATSLLPAAAGLLYNLLAPRLGGVWVLTDRDQAGRTVVRRLDVWSYAGVVTASTLPLWLPWWLWSWTNLALTLLPTKADSSSAFVGPALAAVGCLWCLVLAFPLCALYAACFNLVAACTGGVALAVRPRAGRWACGPAGFGRAALTLWLASLPWLGFEVARTLYRLIVAMVSQGASVAHFLVKYGLFDLFHGCCLQALAPLLLVALYNLVAWCGGPLTVRLQAESREP